MSHSDPPPGTPAPFRTCDNCDAALQGGYCHLCGQSEHSPVRHFGHAVEEVFESFWHLDGRIFRTLRDLCVPGRVANQYLAGHRVRYVAPMRLFVVLTVLTFFVAQFLVGSGDARPPRASPPGEATAVSIAIEEATSIAEVERIRDRTLAELAQARDRIPAYLPGADAGIVAVEGATRRQASERIAQLRRTQPGTATGPAEAAEAAADADGGADPPAAPAEPDLPAPVPATPEPDPEPEPEADRGDAPAARDSDRIESGVAGLDRLSRNAERIGDNPRAFFRALLGAAPMTLFITVPLFAVLLKLIYVFRRRLYLEHVVVALYSHAWLMLALLLYFVCVLVGGWLATRAAWAVTSLSWLQNLLLLSMPLYLLWMQKRVYGQSWPVTVLKYCVIGSVYLSLLTTVAGFVAFYVLFTM